MIYSLNEIVKAMMTFFVVWGVCVIGFGLAFQVIWDTYPDKGFATNLELIMFSYRLGTGGIYP